MSGESGPVGNTNVSVSRIETVVSGAGGPYQAALSFLKPITKPVNTVTNLGATRGFYYFMNTNQGNCDTNPVPAAATNSGNIQCQNCSLSAVNCANCDNNGQGNCSYLQAACNCACTYNCTTNTDQTYNCDCNCNCNCLVCQCACW